MARHRKPLIEPEIQPKRKSKRGSVKVSDDSAPKKVQTHFQKRKETKCAVCEKTDHIAKPFIATMGSVHPKCHDQVMTERRKAADDKYCDVIDLNEEKARNLGYPMCIICKKYADQGDKIFVYSDSEIVDGKMKGSVHRSCFEQLAKTKNDRRIKNGLEANDC